MMKKLFNWPKTKQKRKAKRLDYTETPMELSALPPELDTPLLFSLHRNCKTLSIALFKEAYCNNNLSVLIISGTPPDNEILDAWNEIIFEYSSLFKSEEGDYLFELAQRIGLLKHEIAYVEYAVMLLRIKYDQDIIDELTRLGYGGEYNWEDQKSFQKQLNRVISICKTNVFDVKQLSDEYDRLNKTTKGKKLNEEEFTRNVLMLGKYQHYYLDEANTSVFQYAMIMNNYLAEMKVRREKVTEDA